MVGPHRIIASRYELERIVGTGGMGEVWAARHLGLGTGVALKLLLPSVLENPALRERFKREARAAAELRSPHIVSIIDFGAEPEPYLVMELLHGETLAARLARSGRLALPEVLRFTSEVARALELAHDAGVVHRDIKPSNIFLARYGRRDSVKVLDFGIAKLSAEENLDPVTSSGVILGSLPYLSPEQAKGDDIDARSDLWSLAVVVYRMLTGVEPFSGQNSSEAVARICSGQFRRATEIAPELAPSVDRFFERALAVDPNRRYATAAEFESALELLQDPAGAAVSENRAGTTLSFALPRSRPSSLRAAIRRPALPLVVLALLGVGLLASARLGLRAVSPAGAEAPRAATAPRRVAPPAAKPPAVAPPIQPHWETATAVVAPAPAPAAAPRPLRAATRGRTPRPRSEVASSTAGGRSSVAIDPTFGLLFLSPEDAKHEKNDPRVSPPGGAARNVEPRERRATGGARAQ